MDLNVAFHEITKFDTEFGTVEVFPLLGYATVQIGNVLTNISNKLPVYIIKHTRGDISTTLWQQQKSGIWKEYLPEKVILMITFP